MRVEIYSDVMCPWCYVGERRFRRALGAFPGGGEVEVVYRPYQLDPSAPERPTPMAEYLRKRFGPRMDGMREHVAGVARSEGIEIDFERGVVVNTLTAHRLLRLAEREYGAETQAALAGKLFEAHFERGGDVSDPALLTDMAVAAGLDRARVEEYLASGEGASETREEIARAARLGVRAVPTFIFDGKFALEGAQPTSTFLAALEEVAQHASPGAGDADGSCAGDSCAV